MAISIRNFQDAKDLISKMTAAGLGGDGRISDVAKDISFADDPTTSPDDVPRFQSNAVRLANKIAQTWNEQYEREAARLKNEAANLANILDTSALSPAEAAKIEASVKSRLDTYNKSVDTFNTHYGTLGFEPHTVTFARTPNGYIEAVEEGERNRTVGRSGELLRGVQRQAGTNPDGSPKIEWDVVGSRSGKVYNTFPDAAQANAYITATQSGATPNPTGAYDFSGTAAAPFVGETVQATPSTPSSSILPNDIDTSGLTPEQVAAAEQAYLDSSADTSLASKLTVTDADIQGFLEKAASETDPYYNQIYTRAREDYQRGLEYKAAVREDELQAEALNATLAEEQAQSQLGEAGLAFSGIRRKTEERLKEQAENIARASRRRFNEEVMQFGRSTEELIGSKSLAGVSLPTIEGNAVFTPTPGVTGSVEREQIANTQTRASELEKQARLRALGTLPESAVVAEELASLY